MAKPDDESAKALERRLERLQSAMGPRAVRRAERADRRSLRRATRGKRSPSSLVAIAVAFIAVAIATGNHAFLIPGITLAVIGASQLLGLALRQRTPDATRAHIGMGADVAAGAVVEPGAVVEMGASIGEGARIRSGAVVRMGCSVHRDVVIEAGAIIGWGCDIEAGAVVEAGAIIGAGATVRAGARVPAGMRVAPGATFALGAPKATGPASRATVSTVGDERRARIEASCARIETEIAQLPETFREHLGATGETAAALRKTCLELLDRERTLRGEASDESLAFLETERTELSKRAEAATDEAVRRSLSSAVAAIDDQRKQRLQLKTHADRIDAEVTRLQWTLDGMSTQLIRLRSAGIDASKAPSGEVMQSVHQLHEEIDAIADALEQVRNTDSPMLQPIEEMSSEPGGAASRDRVR